MLEFKRYGEVDLHRTPIVVLGCGHFFTAETLDGHVGMAEVYEMDDQGEYIGLEAPSVELARSIPRCPDCQGPVRQYVSRRYNRPINRAVIDETSKRFLVSGTARLRELDGEANRLELDLDDSRPESIERCDAETRLNAARSARVIDEIERRARPLQRLAQDVVRFVDGVGHEEQPLRKLHQATLKALQARPALVDQMERLTVQDVPVVATDQRILMGGQLLQVRVTSMTLADKMQLTRNFRSSLDATVTHETTSFFASCRELLARCADQKLPKIDVEARLYYGQMANLHRSFSFARQHPDFQNVATHVDTAKELLEEARAMCHWRFQNVDGLRAAVDETLRLLGSERYEAVSADEMKAIKAAMLGGAHGMATHSGHWYNCQNGHTVSLFVCSDAPDSETQFAIGECGMPMEQARCPECGAPIGGQHHALAAGVTRATEVED